MSGKDMRTFRKQGSKQCENQTNKPTSPPVFNTHKREMFCFLSRQDGILPVSTTFPDTKMSRTIRGLIIL